MTRSPAVLAVVLLVLARVAPAAAMPAQHSGGEPEPLLLPEVLRAVEEAFPPQLAAEAARGAAEGRRLRARGRFDTRLLGDSDLRPTGFYENYAGSAMLDQRTRWLGLRLFGGYRVGRGDFASYDGVRQTDRGGEVFGGIEMPLLRDLRIDEPRAELRRADLDVDRIALQVELQRIEFRRDASVAYWDWLATALTVGVEERLLDAAEQRQSQIEGRVARGALAPVDLRDNERLIVDRRIRLRRAQQQAEQSAIALSLFYRGADGEPVVAGRERLPADFPPEDPPDRDRAERDVERATEGHPLLAALGVEIEQTRVARDLARNQRLPAVGLRVEASSDLGRARPGVSSEGTISGRPRGETELKMTLRYEFPVQQREARGELERLEAELRRLQHRRRFASDRTAAEIRQALAGLEAAYDESLAAQSNLELARLLERAEERRRVLGISNLLNVNIRELQTAEADRARIEANARYFRAAAVYEAAVALVR